MQVMMMWTEPVDEDADYESDLRLMNKEAIECNILFREEATGKM
jgi:hypothetical protein